MVTLYEDFTTFTEVDVAADRIQKTANHVDHVAERDETTYLYKDYGASHFDDFIHKVKVKAASGDTSGFGAVWVLANDLDDLKALETGNKTCISLSFLKSATDLKTRLGKTYGGASTHDENSGGFSFGDWVYAKIVKSGTSLNAYLYSDSDYSVLVDTLTLTLDGDWSFRYLYGCNSYNDSTNVTLVTDIDNFDIGNRICSDSGAGAEAMQELLISLASSDLGAGADATLEIINNVLYDTDVGSGVEAIAAQLAALVKSDVGEGVDSELGVVEYAYYNKGVVNATTEGEQTNYQLELIVGESSGASGVDLHCNGHCEDFPNDIRFMGADGITKHDYWIDTSSLEGTTPNRKVSVWIEVTTIPASGSVDFYMYYGKSGDSSESDGDDTFELFDDFTSLDYFVDKINGFSESTAYLQGVCCDGTHVYVTAKGASHPGMLLKYTKAGSLVASRSLSTVTDHVYHISDLTVDGDYLYVADFKNWSTGQVHANAEGQIVKFNKSDLAYANETRDVGDHWAESVKYWDGSWWVSFHCCSIIRKYNSSWSFVKEYDIAGHGATEEDWASGNGYQGMSVWEQDSKVYFGLTVHNNESIPGHRRFYIFEYIAGSDSFSFVKYIEKGKGEFCHDQGWDVESGTDGSVCWFADRVNAKIVKADVTTCFDGLPGLDTSKWNSSGSPVISGNELVLDNDDAVLSKTTFGYNHRVKALVKANEQDNIFIAFAETIATHSTNSVSVATSDYWQDGNYDCIGLYSKKVSGQWIWKDSMQDFRTSYLTYVIKRISGSVKSYQDDVLVAEETNATYLPTINLAVQFAVWDSSVECTQWIKWIFVGKYVSPEPTWGSWGGEIAIGGILLADVLRSEVGSGIDTILALVHVLYSTDVGVGADTRASLLAELLKVDIGEGIESLGSRLFGLADVGAGLDAISEQLVTMLKTEIGSGVEESSLVLKGSDSGVGEDMLSELLASLSSTDSGSGLDAALGIIWVFLLLKLVQERQIYMTLSQEAVRS